MDLNSARTAARHSLERPQILGGLFHQDNRVPLFSFSCPNTAAMLRQAIAACGMHHHAHRLYQPRFGGRTRTL
jgi:hypothetical protein